MAIDYQARLNEAKAAGNQGLVDFYTNKINGNGQQASPPASTQSSASRPNTYSPAVGAIGAAIAGTPNYSNISGGAASGSNLTPQNSTASVLNNPVASPKNFDIVGAINDLKQAQYNKNVANFAAARDASLSNLSAERATIAPEYYDKGNQARTTAANQAKGFTEYLASQGLSSSGVAADVGSRQNMALSGQLGLLGRQEQAAYDDIARRTSDVNNIYNNNLANANSEADIFAAQQMIEELGRQRDYSRQDADTAYNRQYQQSRDAVNDSRYNQEYNDSRADLNYNRDYQASRDAAADQQWQQQFDEGIRQYNQNAEQWQQQFNEGIRQFNSQFNENQRQWNEQYAFDQQRESFAERQQEIENAYQNRQLSLNEAELQLSRDKYAADRDPMSFDNQLKALSAGYQIQVGNDGKIGLNYVGSTLSDTEQKNADMADDYATLSNMSVADAVNTMNSRWPDFIAAYGPTGANQLWNSVLADAIAMGQAQPK